MSPGKTAATYIADHHSQRVDGCRGKVLLLEFDYVTKPLSLRELLARVRLAIRSTRKPIICDEVEFDGIRVDFTAMEASREGQPVALTAEEFKILKVFLHNEERTISREELLKGVRDHHDSSSLRTIDPMVQSQSFSSCQYGSKSYLRFVPKIA